MILSLVVSTAFAVTPVPVKADEHSAEAADHLAAEAYELAAKAERDAAAAKAAVAKLPKPPPDLTGEVSALQREVHDLQCATGTKVYADCPAKQEVSVTEIVVQAEKVIDHSAEITALAERVAALELRETSLTMGVGLDASWLPHLGAYGNGVVGLGVVNAGLCSENPSVGYCATLAGGIGSVGSAGIGGDFVFFGKADGAALGGGLGFSYLAVDALGYTQPGAYRTGLTLVGYGRFGPPEIGLVVKPYLEIGQAADMTGATHFGVVPGVTLNLEFDVIRIGGEVAE